MLRVIPFLDGNELRIDGVLPDTQRGRDVSNEHPGTRLYRLILGIQDGT